MQQRMRTVKTECGLVRDNHCGSGNNRNKTLDIVKGLGIILMVVGHSRAPMEHFISLFHMAVFFMASGYCWKNGHVDDFRSAKNFVIKRMRSLWIPFALCNGLFSVFHNVFLKIGIYTSDANVLLLDPAMHRRLKSPMELAGILWAVFKNMLFAGDTQLGGAMWFLRTLFCVSIIHLVLRYITVHCKHGRLVQVVSVGGSFIMAELVSRYDIQLPMGIHTCFAAYVAFLCGELLRRTNVMEIVEAKTGIFLVGSILVLLIGNVLGSVGMNSGEITNIVFFLIMSLAGWILLWGISTHIKGIYADVLRYCGQHSIWIVMLHFLAFKLVSVAYQKWTGATSLVVAVFPAIEADFLWIAYTLVGITVPLLINIILRCCMQCGKNNSGV